MGHNACMDVWPTFIYSAYYIYIYIDESILIHVRHVTYIHNPIIVTNAIYVTNSD